MPKSLGNLESYQARLQSHVSRRKLRILGASPSVRTIPCIEAREIKILHFKTVSLHFAKEEGHGGAAAYTLYSILAQLGSMGARGFVFSLDAFVAFVLIMITINLLIFTIGTPKPYFAELESAHILAYDTLQVLATSGDVPPAGEPAQTYLERILGDWENTGEIHGIMTRVAGGDAAYPSIIPRGYGYRLEYLDFGISPGGETWNSLYDSGIDGCPDSDRCGKNFTKLQASATTFLSIYDPPPFPGESPFCHAGCRGYGIVNGVIAYDAPCNTTPCDKVNSNFLPGNNTMRIVRLIVYT